MKPEGQNWFARIEVARQAQPEPHYLWHRQKSRDKSSLSSFSGKFKGPANNKQQQRRGKGGKDKFADVAEQMRLRSCNYKAKRTKRRKAYGQQSS